MNSPRLSSLIVFTLAVAAGLAPAIDRRDSEPSVLAYDARHAERPEDRLSAILGIESLLAERQPADAAKPMLDALADSVRVEPEPVVRNAALAALARQSSDDAFATFLAAAVERPGGVREEGIEKPLRTLAAERYLHLVAQTVPIGSALSDEQLRQLQGRRALAVVRGWADRHGRDFALLPDITSARLLSLLCETAIVQLGESAEADEARRDLAELKAREQDFENEGK